MSAFGRPRRRIAVERTGPAQQRDCCCRPERTGNHQHPMRYVLLTIVLGAALQLATSGGAGSPLLDAAASKWVDRTLASMSADDKAGQLVFPGLDSTFLSTDTETFDRLRELVER